MKNLKTPLVVINFKTYLRATGGNAVKLAKIIAAAAKRSNVAVAVSPIDLAAVARAAKVPVLAQHTDAVEAGQRTGAVVFENLKAAGAVGTLINHSEKRVPRDHIKWVVDRGRELGLTVIVCSQDVEESLALAEYKPDYLAVEPPELIGSGISVSTAKPEVVSNAVAAVKGISPKTKVLCGAGISSGSDVRAALRLGADGVLLASYVANAKDQKKAIKDILGGLRA